MAKLKRKQSPEVTEENLTEDINYMTEEEKEVLEEDGQQYQEEQSKVSSEKMNEVIQLLQEEFNLKNKGFEVVGYADKGNKIVVILANSNYEATITLKSQDTIMRLNLK